VHVVPSGSTRIVAPVVDHDRWSVRSGHRQCYMLTLSLPSDTRTARREDDFS
jgi:hypothetical protein